MGILKGKVSLDSELVSSVISLVSVDAAALIDGMIIDSNTSLNNWAAINKGWTSAKGHALWEIVPSSCSEAVRDWYQKLNERGDDFGLFEYSAGKDDGQCSKGRMYLLKSQQRSMAIIQRPDDTLQGDQLPDIGLGNGMFEDFLSTADLGLAIMNNEATSRGLIRFVSLEGQKILQRDSRQLEGTEFVQLVQPRYRRLFTDLYQEVEQGRNMRIRDTVWLSDETGNRIVIEAWMGPTVFEGKDSIYMIFKDDTPRFLLLEELQRFVTAFNRMAEIIIIANKEFNISYINPIGLVRTGFEFGEVMDKPVVALLASQGEEDEIDDIIGTLKESGYWIGERWARCKEGSDFPVEISISVEMDADGNPEVYIVTMKDLTARKEVEFNVNSERDRAVFFTELLSHDLMGYIMGLMGEMDLLSHDETEPEGDGPLTRAKEIIDRMARLVAQVSVLCQTKTPNELRPIDLRRTLERVLEVLHLQYEGHSPRIDLVIPGDVLMVQADNLLDNLFLNILDNAVKFNDREDPFVDIYVERTTGADGDIARIVVADNGPGMPDEEKAHAFFKYFRRYDAQGGKGLGLHIVRSLAQRYHGNVWIEDRVRDNPSEGSRVVVDLPIVSSSGPPETMADPPSDPVAEPNDHLEVE